MVRAGVRGAEVLTVLDLAEELDERLVGGKAAGLSRLLRFGVPAGLFGIGSIIRAFRNGGRAPGHRGPPSSDGQLVRTPGF